MTDREMLELAAKAAGYTLTTNYYHPGKFFIREGEDEFREWNPLTDDGDALRLAVKLRMRVEPWGSGAAAVVFIDNRAQVAEPHYGDDPDRATRRAIVRTAAEIGKRMGEGA